MSSTTTTINSSSIAAVVVAAAAAAAATNKTTKIKTKKTTKKTNKTEEETCESDVTKKTTMTNTKTMIGNENNKKNDKKKQKKKKQKNKKKKTNNKNTTTLSSDPRFIQNGSSAWRCKTINNDMMVYRSRNMTVEFKVEKRQFHWCGLNLEYFVTCTGSVIVLLPCNRSILTICPCTGEAIVNELQRDMSDVSTSRSDTTSTSLFQHVRFSAKRNVLVFHEKPPSLEIRRFACVCRISNPIIKFIGMLCVSDNMGNRMLSICKCEKRCTSADFFSMECIYDGTKSSKPTASHYFSHRIRAFLLWSVLSSLCRFQLGKMPDAQKKYFDISRSLVDGENSNHEDAGGTRIKLPFLSHAKKIWSDCLDILHEIDEGTITKRDAILHITAFPVLLWNRRESRCDKTAASENFIRMLSEELYFLLHSSDFSIIEDTNRMVFSSRQHNNRMTLMLFSHCICENEEEAHIVK